ncbi:MAG: alpha-amylase family glycosyl hydrolase [Methylococcaceae bacterium]|nr:alpha-amylase family glycosyl hydrolase [Methylococcaceae bacterium]
MRIYNLFPLLAGPFKNWKPHLERAAEMGFNWIFVNPIQKTGRSGSLYSIQDYFAINPVLLNPRSSMLPEKQIRTMIDTAEKFGLSMMVDLVINHCAYDSELLKEYPQWFAKEGSRIAHPFCTHDGQKVVWHDLASFDHQRTSDPEGLYRHCLAVVQYLIGLGFKGFRCDAAYQIPAAFWRRLIEEVKREHPDTVFVAETLGCSPDQTKETARAGFDFIFNSSKWWDFESPWLLEQYHLTRATTPSISFAESHDTPRLFEECHGNLEAMKQRYLFSALFSAGVMMPMGFEFGFRKPLHVVETKPTDWEETEVDLTTFIREVNHIKSHHRIFQEESITELWGCSNPAVLLMWKASTQDSSQALIFLNKDPWNRQRFYLDDLHRYVQTGAPLVDVSVQWPMDYLPTPFDYELLPGMARILVAA